MRRDERLRRLAGQQRYERVDSVPDGLTWKPRKGRPSSAHTTLFSIGNIYKLVRVRETGDVTYYRLREAFADAKSPAEQIDAEPVPLKQQRFRAGTFAWFVDTGARWYCVEVVSRDEGRIIIRPTTGWDAERVSEWPYGNELEFPARPNNPLFMRLRKLNARKA